MNLFDATLDLASFAKGTEDYKITAVDQVNNQIQCEDLAGRVSEFGGGTIWFRSGESAGKFGRIKSSAAQTIDLLDTFTDGYAVGDLITIGSWLEFDTQKLINAINSVLRTYKVMDYNFDLEWDTEQDLYELPEGVTDDIRQIRLQDRVTGKWVLCHYWEIIAPMTLKIYERRKMLYSGDIVINYVRYHGEISKDDDIHPHVDPLYLRYMAWLYLCRNLIQQTHKDNLVSSDMYNEAKIYERDHATLPLKKLQKKTICYPQW